MTTTVIARPVVVMPRVIRTPVIVAPPVYRPTVIVPAPVPAYYPVYYPLGGFFGIVLLILLVWFIAGMLR